MHAILAIAALHLSRRCEPDCKQQWLVEAHAHHITSAQMVAPKTSSLIEDHGTAVILFSWLTCVYTCSRLCAPTDTLILDRGDGPAEWLTQFRRNKVILDSGSTFFREGILALAFSNGARESSFRWNIQVNDGEEYVWRLRRLITEQGMGSQQDRMYMDSPM